MLPKLNLRCTVVERKKEREREREMERDYSFGNMMFPTEGERGREGEDMSFSSLKALIVSFLRRLVRHWE